MIDRRKTPPDKERAIKRMREGLASYRQIQREYQCSSKTVARIVRIVRTDIPPR